MATRSKEGKGDTLYIKIGIFYDQNTKAIHVTSVDKDLKPLGGLHFNPPRGKHADLRFRALLESYGISCEPPSKPIPPIA